MNASFYISIEEKFSNGAKPTVNRELATDGANFLAKIFNIVKEDEELIGPDFYKCRSKELMDDQIKEICLHIGVGGGLPIIFDLSSVEYYSIWEFMLAARSLKEHGTINYI